MSRHERTERVLGAEGLARLRQAHVAVFGLGGVGSYAAEALARAGVGRMTLVDGDVVQESNINRQLCALYSTLGMKKTDVVAARLRDILPEIELECLPVFFGADTALDMTGWDFAVDAIDTVTSKVELIVRARAAGVPVISCMGAGNKLHPESFMIDDVSRTSVCPLARAVRKQLRERGIERGVAAVYSTEEPAINARPPGSLSFVPGAMGLVAAGYVIRQLSGAEE